MTILSSISLLSAACALVLSVIILQKQPRRGEQVVYLLLSLVISFVAFTEFGFRQAESMRNALFWLKASEIAPVIISLIALFTGLYTGDVFYRKTVPAFFTVMVPGLLFWGIDISTGTLSGHPVITRWGWGQSATHSFVYHVYTAWVTVLLVLSAFMAIRYYVSRRKPAERAQAKYVALAITMVAFITIIIDTGMNYLHMQLPEYATLAYAVANILIAYAIWRHQLFRFSPAVAAGTIIDTMADALFLVLPDGTIAHVNNAGCRMFGGNAERYRGRKLDEFISAETPLLQKNDKGYCASDEKDEDISATGCRNGLKKMYSVATRSVRDRQGVVLGTVVAVRDITDRMRIEQALRESHEKLEERVKLRTEELRNSNERLLNEREWLAVTLRSIGDAVITSDTNGRVTFVNDVGEAVCGWGASDAYGKKVNEILRLVRDDTAEESADPVTEVLQSGKRCEFSGRACVKSRTGEVRRIDLSAAPIRSNEQKLLGAVVVFRDITEKEMLEEELLKVKRLESVALLAGGIAHDFNNMLTSINNNLFLGKMAAERPDEVVSVIHEAERDILRAKHLAGKLLTFAQGGDPVTTVCSPRNIIEESIGFFLSGSNCSYELVFDDDLMNIRVDRGMIEQVLSNCIINAEQAMEEGGHLQISVENTLVDEANGMRYAGQLKPGTYIRIAVTDQGHGIPEDIRDRIYDPFFSTKGHGRGLGLSIVRSIVQKHEGTVIVDATGPLGTTVSMYLPSVEESVPEQLEKEMETNMRCTGLRGHKILLLDDDEGIRKSTGRILAAKGYLVETAADGVEAVALFRRAVETGYLFDLVILDLTVSGGMGGVECCERLKMLDPNVIAIVSSGYSTDAVMSRYEEFGFAGVLKKPYDVIRLDKTIQTILESHQIV